MIIFFLVGVDVGRKKQAFTAWIEDDYQRKMAWLMSKQDLIDNAAAYVFSNPDWISQAHSHSTVLTQAAGLEMIPSEFISRCHLDIYFAGNDAVLNKVKAQWRSHKHDKSQTRQVSVSEDVYKIILGRLKPFYGTTSVSSTIELAVRQVLENQKIEKQSEKLLKIRLDSLQTQLAESNMMINVLRPETSKKIEQLRRIAHDLIHQKEVLLKRITDAKISGDGIDVSPQVIITKDIERKLSELEAHYAFQTR